MKIKGLLLGMLACAAMVACTNEDIVENNNGGQPEKANANLTLSISTSTGSGRSAETGDDTENGTTEEGTLQDAVVVISPAEGNPATGLVQYMTVPSTSNGLFEPEFQLKQTGKYEVLVILNPCTDIATKAQSGASASDVYDYVTNYSITGGADNNASVDVVTGNARNHFMMANQEAVEVEITSQDPERPTTKSVTVERVVSKVTFTPNDNENKYPVEVTVTTIPTVKTDGWLKTEVDGKNEYTYITVLNKAFLDGGGAEIWVLLNDGAENARYELESNIDNIYSGIVKGGVVKAPVFVETTKTGTFHYARGEAAMATENWNVYLDKYAMVNLSKTVYAVRHKTSDWATITPMGLLTGSDYLVDPNSAAKNQVTLTDAGLWGGDGAKSYFFNTVNELQTSQDIYSNDFLNDLPKKIDVEIGEDKKSQDAFLTYCLENVVKKENQKKGMVTGIVFRGEILDVAGNNVGTIYKYNNQFFRSMDALKAVYPTYTQEDLVTYKNGHCYYYAPIEHFKGDENNMQYAIMRNNIYSLKITSFKGIGSSTIIPEDGTTIDDESAYLELTTTIAPWVVRFNNIEF